MCWQYYRIDRPVLVPDYEGREADEMMLAEIIAKSEELVPLEDPFPNGMY